MNRVIELDEVPFDFVTSKAICIDRLGVSRKRAPVAERGIDATTDKDACKREQPQRSLVEEVFAHALVLIDAV